MTFKKIFVFLAMLTVSTFCFGQETTASVSGVVKDGSGAVISGAIVEATAPSLTGIKTTKTDSHGEYHFLNLPPGPYVLTVKSRGFATLKHSGLVLEVGHAPTLDLTLSIGTETTVVDVSTESPQIDVSTVTTQTNITQDVLDNVPTGRSFQSVIQFAPGASNEPLFGNPGTTGSGGNSPGSQSNGNSYGYSVAGGSDSENSYLVEGQETANIIGGYSHTNVPTDFIGEVQIKSSGIEAEHGGALGGVVNVVMKKGSTKYHGSVFTTFESQGLDAGPTAGWGYNPLLGTGLSTNGLVTLDQGIEYYQPKKAHYSYMQPGFTLSGPLFPINNSFFRDRFFFFVGFNPEIDRAETHVNYNAAAVQAAGSSDYGLGNVPFSQNTNTYYTTARIDATVTKKIRVFGSWLYQLQRLNGEGLPGMDPTDPTLYNTAAGNAPSIYAHTIGFSAPNTTVNTGVDYTISNSLVSTTRFGYYFENYHDFGYGTTGDGYIFNTNGIGATSYTGTPVDSSFNEPVGYQSQPVDNETFYNSNKAIQVDEAVSWYKSGWAGTHNFKFGYDLARLSNLISQAYNVPIVELNVGGNQSYSTSTATGLINCPTIAAANGTPITLGADSDTCQGSEGYYYIFDYGTGGKAISYNNALFAQDTWNIKHGVTLNLGIRAEKENIPGEVEGPGVPANPINFSWGDKIAPRLGASWDVFQNGKMKLFGSYGVFFDQMKLNLAISSFGGQYWNNCYYALNSGTLGNIDPVYTSSKRVCQGQSSAVPGNFPGGTQPTGSAFIENVNERAGIVTCATCNPYEEAVAPNLKPYQQHETQFGADYQLSKTLALNITYDRRRLDHVIEDASIFNPAIGETFVIVNPGQGVDSTYLGFCNFLYSQGTVNNCSNSSTLPPNSLPSAARSYDGLEFRLNKAVSNHWFGMISYTYSHFRGNYTGLTSSDESDGGGGRVAPNNSRAFDEPYFSFNSNGGSSSGLLPTDRPNKVKGYAYYQFKYLKNFTTNLGVFDYIYQGSPNTTYLQDVGDVAAEDFPVDVFNRGKWANFTQEPNAGAVTVGNVHTYRNPLYAQTDFKFDEQYKLPGSKALSFGATFANLFNERAVTAVYEQADSNSGYINGGQQFVINGENIGGGTSWYAAAMNPYNVASLVQANPGSYSSTESYSAPQTISALYGKPYKYQQPRTLRLDIHFTF